MLDASPPPAPPDREEAPEVDPTLVAETLRLTPDERLRLNDRMATTILELRDAFAARRAEPAG